ncbi:MAG: hypothetical protein ACKOX7_03060 [Bacteroidota bacterium]
MRLKTKSRTFRLPNELFEADKRAFRVDEKDDELILKNQHGLLFRMKKSIVTANELHTELGCIDLPDSIYARYVTPLIKKANENCGERLYSKFALVMDNHHLVLKNPEYFLIRAPWLSSGVAMSGPINYCLGSLIETWKRDGKLKSKDENGDMVFVAKVSGGLSGLASATAWNPSKRCFVRLNKSSLPGGLPVWLANFSKLQSNYRESLLANFAAINKLLEECEKVGVKRVEKKK